MTESKWLVCHDPKWMLRFLLGTNQPRIIDVEAFPDCKGSDRKLRLFACSCYIRIRHLLPNPLAQAAVEVGERFADDRATIEELKQAGDRLQRSLDALEGPWRASRGAERTTLQPTYEALALAKQITLPEAPKAAYYASSNAYMTAASIANPEAASYEADFCVSQRTEERAQADLLRCIFGPLPFRPVAVEDTWRTASVLELARLAYEDRDFTVLPVLADAVEDAGCTNDDILGHLRGTGPHTRGCFAVDLLLGRC
jgi:hypothetical protein